MSDYNTSSSNWRAINDARAYLKPEEVIRLIDACKSSRDKLLIKTLAFTGRRISELVGKYNKLTKTYDYGLKPEDIDFENCSAIFTILKKNPKRKGKEVNDKPIRDVKPLPAELLNELIAYIKLAGVPTDKRIF